MAEHARRHFVGFEPEISTFKAKVEAALIASGVGWWMWPIAEQPPVHIVQDDSVSAFMVCCPTDVLLPATGGYLASVPDNVMAEFEGGFASAARKLAAAAATGPVKPASEPKTAPERTALRTAALAVVSAVKVGLSKTVVAEAVIAEAEKV